MIRERGLISSIHPLLSILSRNNFGMNNYCSTMFIFGFWCNKRITYSLTYLLNFVFNVCRFEISISDIIFEIFWYNNSRLMRMAPLGHRRTRVEISLAKFRSPFTIIYSTSVSPILYLAPFLRYPTSKIWLSSLRPLLHGQMRSEAILFLDRHCAFSYAFYLFIHPPKHNKH